MSDILPHAMATLRARSETRLSVEPEQIVETLRDDVGRLRASRHPLGFLHLDLAELAEDDSVAVRLHLWSDSFNAPDGLGTVHDHTWHLSSALLHGSLTDTTFELEPDAAGGHRTLVVQYGSERDELVFEQGRVKLHALEHRDVAKGSIYRLPAGAIHRTTVHTRPTATLVLAEPTRAPGPRVFTDLEASAGQTLFSERESVDVKQAALELDRLLLAMRSI